MKQIVFKNKALPVQEIAKILEEHDICINKYAEEYFLHPLFSFGGEKEITLTIASLKEIGLEDGATLDEIFEHIKRMNLKPCFPGAAVSLRLAWKDQPVSSNSIISGTHDSPDQAVMVLSRMLEKDDFFPKGLYLRNIDGKLWLRGYVCDDSYRFPGDALFAFEVE